VGTLSVVVSLASCTACDGSGSVADRASNFTGPWTGAGSLTPSLALPPDTAAGIVVFPVVGSTLTSTGPNVLELDNICFGSDRVPAQVTSDTSFDVSPYPCDPVPSPEPSACPGPTTMSVDGGSGSLSGGSLVVAATGTMTTCGQTYTFIYSFSGQRP
jgi:hypothetical protein